MKLDTFARTLTTIETRYVDPVESDTLVYAAIRGMTEVLDPHSMFLDPATWAELQDRAEGRAWRLGLTLVTDEEGHIGIEAVVPGGPAELAGVQAAKQTPALIPLCHTLLLGKVDVRATVETGGVRVTWTDRALVAVQNDAAEGVQMDDLDGACR